ncbi:MAG: DUF2971 domain-containing protein [Saprospiraceae bacterium]|nr:DUF2971 domain-containing protein [Saprospiraceae bacterium]
MERKPETIYRFESFNTLTLKNLVKSCIYFGSPKSFNDPYDCAINASIHPISIGEVMQIKNSWLSDPKVPEHHKNEIVSYNNEELIGIFTQIANNVINTKRDEYSETIGVVCFTENSEDALMWAHYGDKYKGFCIEFDTKFELFKKLRKVIYLDEMPLLNPLPFFVDDQAGQFADLYNIKFSAWSYEKEWRLIHKERDTSFHYPPEAVINIYIGPLMEEPYVEVLSLIVKNKYPHANIIRGQLSNTHFKVEF